jgi:putative phosphotransacetylase
MDQDRLVQLITEMVKEQLKANGKADENKPDSKAMVPVGISARHVHLSREHLDILFGKDYELVKKKELMGGQFAAEECVTIIGQKLSAIEKVRILGPLRKESQVEISRTDAIKLGVKAPIRESGNLAGSAPITIIGPNGAVVLRQGCIIAKRHIHMSTEDGERFGIKDNQIVSVKIIDERGGILENVQVRVHPTYTLEMHIDTDEANGLGIKPNCMLEVIK